MKVKVLEPCEIDLNPGDLVILYNVWTPYDGFKRKIVTTIKRVIESNKQTYCTFNDGYGYRPISTYGISWKKVFRVGDS